jgi:hypothetical protein
MDGIGLGLNTIDSIGAWPDEVVAAGWTQAMADAMAWGSIAALLLLVPLLVLFSRAVRQRHFWCLVRRRDVEVEMEERGLPGLRRAVAIRSCSAFEPPTAVTCRRSCLEHDCRRLYEPMLSRYCGGLEEDLAVSDGQAA